MSHAIDQNGSSPGTAEERVVLRKMRPEETDELCRGADQTFRPSQGQMARDFPALFAPANAGGWYVARAGDRIVAAVGTLQKEIVTSAGTLPGVMLGGVFTLPAYQRRGLATRLLAMATENLRDEGSELALISGALPIYSRAGAAVAGLFLRAEFSPDQVQSPAWDVEVRPLAAKDAAAALVIYDRKPVRFVRRLPAWLASLQTGRAEDRPSRCDLVLHRGTPVAYLVTCPADSHTIDVVESAGPFEFLWTALPSVARDWNATWIRFWGDSPDAEYAACLARRGVDVRREPFPGMLLVLSPERLWQRISPWLLSRLPPQEQPLVATWPGETLELRFDQTLVAIRSPAELCELLFGEGASRLPPPLDTLLSTVLPVGLPRYGLDFV